ncbi:SusC/RagA family TonB-linked outer membrane protein [Prolixibacteraceae bacterium JC049]|nr:SusC/RagA family TonB-linked outer membrane protein [Prolixibacteraceae bacterium JC049]
MKSKLLLRSSINRLLIIFSLVFGLGTYSYAQKVTVKGKVTGEDGIGMPGVTIVEKSTTNGLVTDIDGNYSISVKDGDAVLVFSFIGMQSQEIILSGRTTLDVTLKAETTEVDEVVVTALGIKKQNKKIGFAVTEVKGDELAQQQVVNPVQSLQGKAAGLSITSGDGTMFGSSKIQLRGVSVLNSSSNQPIFVVDGVIMEVGTQGPSTWGGDNSNDFGSILKNLDSDNFQSVSVLKGAAATALYGSRGINGAIIIRTKGADAAGKGMDITVKQTFGFDHVYDQPEIQYEFGPGYFSYYSDYGSGNQWDTQQFKMNSDNNPTIKGINPSWLWGKKFDPSVQYEYWDGKLRPYAPVKDGLKKAFEVGTLSSTHVDVSGGNEKTRFYLSDTYTKREGIYPNNKFTKNSLKLSASHKLYKNLTAKADITLTSSKPENPNNSLGRAFIYGKFSNMYDPTVWGKKEISTAPHGGIPNAEYGDEYAYLPGNGIWFNYYNNTQVRKEDLVKAQISMTYEPFKWLTLKGEYYRVKYNTSFEKKNADQSFAQKGDGGYYKVEHTDKLEETWKLTGFYNYDVLEDLNVSGIVGVESWETESSRSFAETNGGLVVPGQYFIANSKKTVKGGAYVDGTKRINSVYGTMSWDYMGQYFLELTGRNDWSSALTYTDGTGNNSYFYPSVSFSWLSDQTFELPEWIDMTKLRASWAKVGNDTSNYFLNQGYKTESKLYNGNVIINYNDRVLMDPAIKPEMKTSWEVGLDFRFLKNRVGLDFAWYKEDIDNQIGRIDLDPYTGYKSLYTNIGALSNKGLELSVFLVPVKTKDFEWKTTLNWWNNETTITKLHEQFGGSKRIGGDTYSHFFTESVAVEGGVYGELRSPQKHKTYYNESDPNDPKNGMHLFTYNDEERCIRPVQTKTSEKVGNIQPDFEYSFNNEFRWKKLSFSFLIDGRHGGTVLSHENRYGTYKGEMKSSLWGRDTEHGGLTYTSTHKDDFGYEYHDGVVIEDCVFDKGTTIVAPSGETVDISGKTMQECVNEGIMDPVHASMYHVNMNDWGGGVLHDGWVTDVKYIALRNINLNYSLGREIAKRIGASELTLGMNVRNVLYLYNNMPNNINPESVRGNTSSASYFIQSAVPFTRSFTFSITAKF